MAGKIKEDNKKELTIKTVRDNKTGCVKYQDDYHGKSGKGVGLLLLDSDNCSLSTKIHFA